MGRSKKAAIRAALKRAIEIAGSAAALARACGYKPEAFNMAVFRGSVSEALALRIDWATGGRVSACELRPGTWETPEDVPRPPVTWGPPLVPSAPGERARERQAP
jgi:DNA-binding transcriptional regulator YdaS (Cro superfamily)